MIEHRHVDYTSTETADMPCFYKNTNREQVLLKIYAPAVCIIQAICLWIYVSGAAVYYGKTVHALSAFQMIIDIFKIGQDPYRFLCGAVLGIIYYVSLITLVKGVFLSVQLWKQLVSMQREIRLDFARFSYNVVDNLVKIIAFFIYCSLVKESAFETNMKTVFFLLLFVVVTSKAITCFMGRYNIESIVANTVYSFFMLASMLLLFSKTQMAAIENLISSIKVALNTSASNITDVAFIVSGMLEPILYIVINLSLLGCLKILCQTSQQSTYGQEVFRTPTRRIVNASVLLCLLPIVLYCIQAGENISLSLNKIYALIQNFLPAFIAVLALYMCTYFPNVLEKPKTADAERTIS